MSGTFAILLGDGTIPLFGSTQYEALTLIIGLAVFLWHYWSLRALPALTTSAVFYYTYFVYLFEGDVALARVSMFLTAAALVFMHLVSRALCCCRGQKRPQRHRRASSVGDRIAALSGRVDTLTAETMRGFDMLDQKLNQLTNSASNAKTRRG